MTDPTAAPSPTSLRPLIEALHDGAAGLDDTVLSHAASLGPDGASAVVLALLQDELTRPRATRGVVRAAHLAGALHLARTAPLLAQAVAVLPDLHPLGKAAAAALTSLGPAGVDALLAAYSRVPDDRPRARVAEVLAHLAPEDVRIREALLDLLERDATSAARLLAARGEWRALPALLEVFDTLAAAATAAAAAGESCELDSLYEPPADCACAICAAEQLRAIANAVRALGGALSEAQREAFDAILDRSDRQWIPFSSPSPRDLAAFQALLGKAAVPGRNAPCHCGSGKKYKKCHLALDERAARA